MKREAFMSRVRAALGSESKEADLPPPPNVDESIMRLVDASADLVAVYAERAEAAGMHVHRTTDAGLADTLGGLLGTLGARAATVGMAAGDDARHVRDALAAHGCTIVDWREHPGISAHYDVDVGITDVQSAFAETGTVVISSDAAHSRGTFIAPPVHVAIVRAADIVPDMIDYWKNHPRPGASGAATVFVTGPSKTADIEGILITGVHGPRAVHVLLLA